MANKVFKDQIKSTMEVHIDDMLVKSVQHTDHLQHLDKAFNLLRQYKVKINSEKGTFRVVFEKFLGYMFSQRGIEADPDQISATLNRKSPACMKEIQMLNGHLATLNRFVSRSIDKCFFQVFKKNGVDFRWNMEFETAFQGLKRYMTSPPLLSKLFLGEMLYLHLAVSESAMNGALVRDDEGVQKLEY